MKRFVIKNSFKENMSRLSEDIKNPDNKKENIKKLDEIRKDQKENGKYYSSENDDRYNPFANLLKK